MPDTAVGRAVWAALEVQRLATLDQIQELSGSEPTDTLPYLNMLMGEKYAETRLSGRANSGESICMFRLLRFTGPQAPYVNDRGIFIDPNLKPPKGGPTKIADNRKPSTSAVIVVAAKKLGRPFDKHQIVAVTGLLKKAPFITSYLRSLVGRGWLERLDGGKWRFNETPPDIAYMIATLEAGAGKEPVDMDAAKRGYAGLLEPRAQGFAVDVLKASGWKVTRLYSEGPHTKTLYQVEKP